MHRESDRPIFCSEAASKLRKGSFEGTPRSRQATLAANAVLKGRHPLRPALWDGWMGGMMPLCCGRGRDPCRYSIPLLQKPSAASMLGRIHAGGMPILRDWLRTKSGWIHGGFTVDLRWKGVLAHSPRVGRSQSSSVASRPPHHRLFVFAAFQRPERGASLNLKVRDDGSPR